MGPEELLSSSNRKYNSQPSALRENTCIRTCQTDVANAALDSLNCLNRSFALSTSLSSPRSLSVRDRLCENVFDLASDFARRLAPAGSDHKFHSNLDSFQLPHILPNLSAYDGSGHDVVPLRADLISLPASAGTVALLDVLPEPIRSAYAVPTPSLMTPHPPVRVPRFHGASPVEYRRLICRMASLGMVSFTDSPVVVNAVFAVRKDGNQQRLIIDARGANLCFADSPLVELPNPEVTAALQVPQGARLYTAKVDLDNFYHRLLLPEWMQPFFALPAVPSSLLGVAGPDRMVYPCCRTLPMGWSHSVYLAQAAHESVLRMAGFSDQDRLSASADKRVDRIRHQVYIDDLMMFGLDPAAIALAQDRYLAVVTRIGLPPKLSKLVRPSAGRVECLGIEVDGSALTIGLAPAKLWALVVSTRQLISRGACTGLELAQLVGRWTWAMMPCRPALAVFGSVYRFIEKAGRRRFALWVSTIRELEAATGLAPLLRSSLSDRLFSRAVAVDASSTGLGVVATRRGAGGDFLNLPEDGWQVIVASKWAYPDHINVLEVRAAATAVRWAIKHREALGSRLRLFSDSLVAVGALSKGRSSSPTLLRRLRSVSAWLLASGMRLLLSWIPSELNPADEPSRR